MRNFILTPPQIALAAGALVILAGGIGFGVANWSRPAPAATSASPPAAARRILYWYDPMIPQEHHSGPGKSSMNMTLIPKYADDAAQGAGVRIDPAAQQNLGVRLATARTGVLAQSIVAPGVIDYDQRGLAVVQARAAGFVQRVYGRAPGDIVRAGAPLADVLVPEWGGAQNEYLAVRRTGDRPLIDAARQRLMLLGMSPAAITAVERSGRAHPVTTITTPVGGAIRTLDVRAGMNVTAGETLAEVNWTSTVWVTASVPQAQSGTLVAGRVASLTVDAYPGETFAGRVSAILPEAQGDSRTVQVRVEVANRGDRLRPGMFATLSLPSATARPAVLVPSEAVIRTGQRVLVMVAQADGRYQPREVTVGREQAGQTEILAGLSDGEQVVASGQFLIDSEASLSDVAPRNEAQTAAAAAGAPR